MILSKWNKAKWKNDVYAVKCAKRGNDALCWAYRKRAFSVSGSFRKALADLITDLHNSKKPMAQITLFGEIIPDEKYYLLGFVNGKDLLIEGNTWFTILNSMQLNLLTDCLKEKCYF